MRRLQANLAYLAAIADRSHKPSSQIPPHPAIISAPPLSPLPKSALKSPKASSPIKNESPPPSETVNGSANGTDVPDSAEDREERILTLKQLYARLQALFPGVDPKKEPPIQKTAPKGQGQRPNAGANSAGNQNANQATNMTGNTGNQPGNQWQGGGMIGQQQQAQAQALAQAQMMAGNMSMVQAQNAQGQGQGQGGR
jgi:hypothetical protein